MSSVLVNGCFDRFHYGHLKFLQQASLLADGLYVGVNSDKYIRRIKGREPRPLAERLAIVGALACVRGVVDFDSQNAVSLIKQNKPSCYATSIEYMMGSPEIEYCNKVGIPVFFIPRFGDWSSTNEAKRVG